MSHISFDLKVLPLNFLTAQQIISVLKPPLRNPYPRGIVPPTILYYYITLNIYVKQVPSELKHQTSGESWPRYFFKKNSSQSDGTRAKADFLARKYCWFFSKTNSEEQDEFASGF